MAGEQGASPMSEPSLEDVVTIIGTVEVARV